MTDSSETLEGFFSAADNPAMSNAIVAAAIQEPEADLPTIDNPDHSFTRLPAGLFDGDKSIRSFEVQELTGAHEERLARINQMEEPGRWFQTLLECGVVSVGGRETTPDLLKSLLIGDREYLSLAIRAATYGTDVELGSVECPKCRDKYDMVFDIRNVPVRSFDGERFFERTLKTGATARIALPDGNAQMALFERNDFTPAETKSILLAQSVQTITQTNGMLDVVAGFPSLIKSLGIVDRNAIIDELAKRQPGPRYDELRHTHECGFETNLSLSLAHLFPGL